MSEFHENGYDPVPSWTPELGTRLGRAITVAGGPKKCGAMLGVKPEQVSKWRDGRAKAPFYAVAAIAAAAGLSVDWIASGQTPGRDDSTVNPLSPVNIELLGRAVQIVEQWLDARDRRMPASKKAEVVAMIYDYAVEGDAGQPAQIDETKVERLLRLVA